MELAPSEVALSLGADTFVSASRLTAGACYLYDSFVSYTVQHGSDERPVETTAASLGAATRIAVAFERENRRNVRVKLPDGRVLPFEMFQAAVFSGALR